MIYIYCVLHTVNRLYSGSEDGTVNVWDIGTNTLINTIACRTVKCFAIIQVCLCMCVGEVCIVVWVWFVWFVCGCGCSLCVDVGVVCVCVCVCVRLISL